MLVFHSNCIDEVIEQLQSIKNQCKVKDLLVDEMDIEESQDLSKQLRNSAIEKNEVHLL